MYMAHTVLSGKYIAIASLSLGQNPNSYMGVLLPKELQQFNEVAFCYCLKISCVQTITLALPTTLIAREQILHISV